MKILLIIGDSKFGGSTYLFIEWATFLVAHGCNVHVLITDSPSIEEFRRITKVTVINTIFIPRQVAPLIDLRAFWELIQLIQHEKYHVVHTCTETSGFLGRFAAWMTRVPVILHSTQGSPVTDFSSIFQKVVFTPLSYIAGLISTRVICAGYGTAKDAERLHIYPKHKVTVIPNGIDPQPFLEAKQDSTVRRKKRSELGVEHCIVIGNANRLAPQKDCTTLIRAMAHLLPLFPEKELLLLLAGDGPERENLVELVQELGISDHVHFLGFHKDIPAFLAAVDIFVNPSLWEGLSISLMEAMAAERPIVATSILPNAELIEHEVTGLLVQTRSPSEIALAIARFIQSPELAQRCGIAASQRILEKYTIDRMLDQTWFLYNTLMHKNRT